MQIVLPMWICTTVSLFIDWWETPGKIERKKNSVYAFNPRAKIWGVVIFGNLLSSLKGLRELIAFGDPQKQYTILGGLKLIFFPCCCERIQSLSSMTLTLPRSVPWCSQWRMWAWGFGGVIKGQPWGSRPACNVLKLFFQIVFSF